MKLALKKVNFILFKSKLKFLCLWFLHREKHVFGNNKGFLFHETGKKYCWTELAQKRFYQVHVKSKTLSDDQRLWGPQDFFHGFWTLWVDLRSTWFDSHKESKMSLTMKPKNGEVCLVKILLVVSYLLYQLFFQKCIIIHKKTVYEDI